MPWNEWGFAGELNISADNNALDLNVESVELSGTFSHNNTPTPATEYDDGNFYLETASGDRVFLENSHFLAYEKFVMLGNYDIYWEVESPGDTVPFNQRARIGSNVSVATGKLDINMTTYPVSGSFTLNVSAFPVSVQHTGQIVLRDTVTGTENVLALTMDGGYDHNVLKGSYDIVYQHLQGEDVPQNKECPAF